MEFALPTIGEGVYEAELVRWLVAPGQAVKPGQLLLEVLTDKATMEVPSPFAGTIDSVSGEPGQTLKIGQPILRYTPTGQAAPRETPVASSAVNGSHKAAPTPTPLAVKASPSVRQLARKLGVDLTSLAGSGPEGRILIDDLSRSVPRQEKPATKAPAPALDIGRPGAKIPLVGMRRRIADHMVHSKHTIPHYSYIDECDVTDLVKLRAALKETYERLGVKLTYLAFVVKAVASALKEVPIVNASLDKDEIVLHDRYHVGIAVATPAGLIVPVIRDADKKDLGAIAREIDRLSSDARAGKSRLEDLRGGTFTVTSVGNLGGLITTPIVNHPEVGILGLGKIVRRPVYDDAGQIRPAELMYLSFSFDHRVVDGAVGAVFGNAVLARLRNPAAMLVQG
jgi:pyruvate dehydrogenase E2 component (dihydrolipoamide acetyltransferase)/2-oxoisovalerate dehydrogenase E2 component (dihydrolipoyl transacylase)